MWGWIARTDKGTEKEEEGYENDDGELLLPVVGHC
jgi:hypothetical protein